MKDKIKNIFSSTECLSEEMLVKYLKNELTSEQKHFTEIHLTDCEICQDLVDGLSELENIDELSLIVSELNQKIDKKLEQTKPKVVFLNLRRIISIAASFLILVGLTYFITRIFTNSDTFMAENSKSESTVVEEKKENSENITNSESDKITESPKSENPLNEQNIVLENKENSFSTDITKTIVVTPVVEDITAVDDIVTTGNANYYSEDIIKEEESLNESLIYNKDESVKRDEDKILMPSILSAPEFANVNTLITDDRTTTKTNINSGLGEFVIENYSDAKTEFDAEIMTNPNNDTALFYKGLSDYQLQNFSEANISFDKILENVQSPFYEAALYFKALSFINQGKKKTAQKLLNEVINLDGNYLQLAKQKLLEIN